MMLLHLLRTWHRLYTLQRRLFGAALLPAASRSFHDALWCARVKYGR
jgi:hypothetical protein